MRWIAPILTALLLSNLSAIKAVYFPLAELPKGSVAPYTIRATHDAVFDLHETFVAEAEEARQSYLPIYNRDEGLPYSHQDKIVRAALAEPPPTFSFPLLPDRGTIDGGAADAGLDRRVAAASGARDAGASDGLPLNEQQRELEALIRGVFKLLESFYRDGVIGDSEFPKEKKTIRVFFRNEYNPQAVAELHRFSSLRLALEQSAGEIFVKTDAKIREQVVNYILQRLPPNLSYAKENEKFITDISQVTGVKVVQIRAGEILVRRGQVVDTRAFYAIRASVSAAAETSRLGTLAGRAGLLLALMLLFVVASHEIGPSSFRSLRPYLVIYGAILLIVVGGDLLLTYFPLHAALVPQAALALTVAVVLGRAPALIAGITVPACLILTQVFDLSTLLVGTAGGVSAALAVRRRRRGTALAAGVIVGVVQAVVFEATRVLEGRPRTYAELWCATQAFLGGLLSGLLAVGLLPFVERLLGRSSRGKLRVITDFDYSLVRELRERAPGTFAHTVRLVNMVEPATEAAGGDRFLARAGTLFHDIGKISTPHHFSENQGAGANVHDTLSPEASARLIIAHVAEGLRIARKQGLPADVSAFIAEHHGTTRVDAIYNKAVAAGGAVDPALYHYPGPKPRSLETAILMLADAVEVASRSLVEPSEEAINDLVDRVVFRKLSEFQFDECGINQADLRRVKQAFVDYLRSALRPLPLPSGSPPAPSAPPSSTSGSPSTSESPSASEPSASGSPSSS